ncbi:MAG: hypothetical protein Q9P14_08375 [candidate division KSB1 bacterium]|nr:hypothetical protein [candidate division KSB1 bacterium]
MKRFLFIGLAAFGLMIAAGLGGCQKSGSRLPAQKVRDLANALYNRELFEQSIREYERYLNNYELSEEEQANVSYTIANIYFERLKDYENALAYYIRIKELYPNSAVMDEAEKRIIESLERLQRSADAQQALAEATFLDPSKVQKKRPGEVIAKIGNREITTGDLEYEMKQLPPFMLEQIKDNRRRSSFCGNISPRNCCTILPGAVASIATPRCWKRRFRPRNAPWWKNCCRKSYRKTCRWKRKTW